MKINHVKISSILGIDELEFEAGQFNEISGQNGKGKTSVLEAIKAAVQGGHDATLLRKGAEKGEVVLVLDDGTEISKRVTPRSSPLTVKGSDGAKAQRPTDVLKNIADLLSVNPVDFLRAPKKDRVRVLLEAMPIEVDPDRLEKISGVKVGVAPGTHALAAIGLVRQQVYDDRTGTNRAVMEKDATINQLRLAMPDVPGGVDGNEDELRAKISEADQAYSNEEQRITNKLSGLREQRDADIAAIEAQIADLRVKIEQRRAEFSAIEGKAEAQRNVNKKRRDDAAQPLHRALDAITANRGAAAKREQVQQTIELMEKDLAELKQDAERQTKALEAIDAYKLELLASLPIPGLEVVDGDLFRDGVPFDRLNTAQQVDIAVEIAKLRAGELKVCCVDGLELLDSSAFEAFRERAIEAGLQLFVSRVSDHEFQVKTDTQ